MESQCAGHNARGIHAQAARLEAAMAMSTARIRSAAGETEIETLFAPLLESLASLSEEEFREIFAAARSNAPSGAA